MRGPPYQRAIVVGLMLALFAGVFVSAPGHGVGASPAASSNAAAAGIGVRALSGIFDAAKDPPDSPGQGTVDKQFCTDGTAFGSNVRVNCDSTKLPHNEVTIAVDPTNPNHLVAGSNDYEIYFVGATIVERIVAGSYVSSDGGATWTTGHVPPGGFTFTGDPAVAFNRKLGLVHYAVIAFQGGQGGGFADASVQVSTSSDGGVTYGAPVVVTLGTGGTRVTIFNDKPFIAVDSNPASSHYGRLYVTWTRFLFGAFGQYLGSPIMLSRSDDGGRTFSAAMEISGSSATFCANPFVPANAGRCNEDQFSSPVVASGGTLYVAFENGELVGAPNFRDQYLVVKSSDGGATFQGPSQAVGAMTDGLNDYPMNVDGRQNLSNSQFRVNSAGNLAADPTSPSTLYVTFSDNRNGGLTGDFHTVTTNTDVFVVRSTNGGMTWSGPLPVKTGSVANNDQFYPWGAVDSTGRLLVAFKDRSYDSANVMYGETLASSSTQGSSFTSKEVDTGLSNPNDSRWFTNGGTTHGKTTFLGDYEGLDVGSDGVAHPIWTDMRVAAFTTVPPGRGHNTQDVFTVAVKP